MDQRPDDHEPGHEPVPATMPDDTPETPDPAATPVPDAAVASPDDEAAATDVTTADGTRSPRASQGETPLYKGEPLDAERGPGLGCFWIQVIMLGVLLVVTPLTVIWAWPAEVSAVLLIVTLALLLFAGQTVIFLLRLVAADRRSRRVPRSASARRTVGMLEDEQAPTQASEGTEAPTDGTEPPRDGTERPAER
jgi:hypothetical protein